MKFFSLLILVIVALVIYRFSLYDRSTSPKIDGLPWQIEIDSNGTSQVFGIKPGQSSLKDAIAVLGHDAKLAVVAKRNETGKLEMYYGHYHAGLIKGKIVLQAGADKAKLIQWKKAAVRVEYMSSGVARKYLLDSDNLSSILQSTVQSITFIPATSLDEAVVIARFGQPAEKIRVNANLTHYLYPALGLDIAVSADRKEVLQYVNPRDFERLRKPLENLVKKPLVKS